MYVFYHTSRSTMSMGVIMCSILPSEEYYSGYGLLTIMWLCSKFIVILVLCKHMFSLKNVDENATFNFCINIVLGKIG